MARKQQLWDYHDTDTPKSWEAFQLYRDMGRKRTLEAVRISAGKSPGNYRQFERWSSKHDWVARANAFDLDQDEKRNDTREKQRDKARRDRAEISDALLVIMRRKLNAMANKDNPDWGDVSALNTNASKALEQSRQEYNDLPTKRTELVDERLLKDVIKAIRSMGQDESDVFNELIRIAKEKAEA